MSEPLLSLRDVRVQYGQFLAVDGLSFDVRAGDLLGLIGPNGAGQDDDAARRDRLAADQHRLDRRDGARRV